MSITASLRRVRRVRHELRHRELEVLRVERLGASFVGVTLAGESLVDFVSDGFDDHIKLILDDGSGEPVLRDYTPRRFDRGQCTLDIEFAVHTAGQASAWAERARPGMRAKVAGPRGSMVVPLDYAWHLLAGDATAVPAIRRRLGEMPASAQVVVVAQLTEAADREWLQSAAIGGLQPVWHWAACDDEFVEQVRALHLPACDGFAWAAGEARTMASVRDLLHVEKGHAREASRVSAYWRRGSQGFHEDL